jgi:hypothetical protein
MILDKIYCPEEQRERADKALRLNGFMLPKTRAGPTIRIKRFAGTSLPAVNGGPKLQGAATLQSQRQGHGYGTSHNQSFQEHLASCELCRRVVQMEKANKGLRLLTG